MLSDRRPSIDRHRLPRRLSAIRPDTGEGSCPAATRKTAHPAAIGSLVALPILTACDGTPVDLLEAGDGRPVILVIVTADAAAIRAQAADIAPYLSKIEAAGARLFLIAPDGLTEAAEADLIVDHGGRFAFTLGLADWDHSRGRADIGRPAGFVLDRVGRVIASALDGAPDLGRLIEALPDRAAPFTTGETTW